MGLLVPILFVTVTAGLVFLVFNPSATENLSQTEAPAPSKRNPETEKDVAASLEVTMGAWDTQSMTFGTTVHSHSKKASAQPPVFLIYSIPVIWQGVFI